uniref:Uncharacterized protein n=1 Tax=Oreochromis niloticus TaxID=8128 RepID=A0A669DGW5_ORENI
MFFLRNQLLALFTTCLFVRTVVYCSRRCGDVLCRNDQICCTQGNNTSVVTCCPELVNYTYYSIAMVTRKLSGILILLLLFALGYFVQRVLCSRSRQDTPPQNGQPAATTSQEMLMESCTPDSSADPAAAAHLPTYDECKHLPTYEETVRDGKRSTTGILTRMISPGEFPYNLNCMPLENVLIQFLHFFQKSVSK